MPQDFYQTLGIEKTATEAEIKKAYRKLAVKWHPDKNPGNEEQASSMFKKIGEAYETLGDASKRSQYDSGGIDYNDFNNNMRGNNGRNQQNFSGFSDRRAHDIFAAFFNDSGFGDMFNDPFFSNDFGSRRQQNGGQQQQQRDPFANMMDPFGGMGFGGMGGFSSMLSGGFGDNNSFSSSSFSSATSYSGSGRSGKSTSTSTYIGPDGKRVTKKETTTYHPDGTSDTTVETDEGQAPRISSGRDAPRITSSRSSNNGQSPRHQSKFT